MPPVIKSSNSMAGAGGIKIAIHSAAGMGKTMLAATCPKPVVILTERTGADSLSEANIRAVFGDKKGITYDIPVVEAYTIPDIEEAIEMCRTDKRFDTIVFDSVSEMSKLKLKAELPLHKNMMQAYGAMANSVDDLLRAMRDDKKNWVFLFHSDSNEVYNDEGEPSATVFVPGFEGQKMQKEFPYMIGDVYCMVAEFDDEGKEQRKLRTRQGDTNYYAKNRRGRLDELEEPHIGRVFWKLTKK
jgi:hypothetical protein